MVGPSRLQPLSSPPEALTALLGQTLSLCLCCKVLENGNFFIFLDNADLVHEARA